MVFDAETHTYTLDGFRIPSVTEILSPLTAGKYPPNGTVEQAARRGSRIHELCALYDMDALPDEIEPETVPYLEAWAAFVRDWQPEWHFIETPLFDPCEWLAGTVDRIGLIDGRLAVVDIKTAQSLDRPARVSLACQLIAYGDLAEQNGIQICRDAALGVQLMKDGTYRLHRASDIMQKYKFGASDVIYSLRRIHSALKGD